MATNTVAEVKYTEDGLPSHDSTFESSHAVKALEMAQKVLKNSRPGQFSKPQIQIDFRALPDYTILEERYTQLEGGHSKEEPYYCIVIPSQKTHEVAYLDLMGENQQNVNLELVRKGLQKLVGGMVRCYPKMVYTASQGTLIDKSLRYMNPKGYKELMESRQSHGVSVLKTS